MKEGIKLNVTNRYKIECEHESIRGWLMFRRDGNEKRRVQRAHDAFEANIKKLSNDAVSVGVGGEDILIKALSMVEG